MMKQCKVCNKEKPLTEYNTRSNRCKPCQYTYSKEWRLNNPDKHKSIVKKYYTSDKGKKTALKSVRTWENKHQGVYGIYENGECLYIGESKRLNGRITDHKYWIRYPHKSINQIIFYEQLSQHKHLIIGVIEETPNHKEREGYWIAKLNPKYNMYQ